MFLLLTLWKEFLQHASITNCNLGLKISVNFLVDDPLETEILAAAPKPGTSLRTATAVKTGQKTASSRPRTSTGRPLTGMVFL